MSCLEDLEREPGKIRPRRSAGADTKTTQSDLGDLIIVLLAGTLAGLRDRL